MRVSTGFIHGYAVADWEDLTTFAVEAERMGVDSIWSAEAWGFDGATPLAYLAAKTSRIKLGTGVLQVGTRTPANMAMTAMSLYSMSNGRFLLGIGTSGPQVMEGFHGVIFDNPIRRTRETIEIMKKVFNGEPVAYEGRTYRLPVREGQGKSIRVEAPAMPQIPIYIASLGPRNLRLTGELADGWKGTSFMPEHADVFFDHIQQGVRDAGRSMTDLDLQAGGTVIFTDDVDEAVEALKPGLAFSLGAMGSRDFNFYNAAYSRAGYADEAKAIQALWLDGRRDEARRLVPPEMVWNSNLLGTDEMVKERIRAYRDAGLTTLSASLRYRAMGRGQLETPTLTERIEVLGHLMDLVNEVNQEPFSKRW
ncbi:MAG: F420-dependent methylene-tetrahydromethanopterin reductase [SAR202 cluster bacterium Io17-Chloro-G6]|nr:MAG: F420-dependent methylene-tetrahydromethanopterin reductase [SAR202 cluster bacterium Io17-Chloro-G6]